VKIKLTYKNFGKPLTETEIKFDVYQCYLKLIREFIEQKHSDKKTFINFLWNNINFKELQNINEKIIKRFLYIGWNTEFLSSLNDERDIDFLKINNHWKPIQSYYAIYSVGEAISYLIDRSVKESHRGCLKKLNLFLVEKIKVEPWCFSYKGAKRNGFIPVNFPQNIKPINSLKRVNVEPINMIATCLRAEHGNIIGEFKPKKLNNTDRKLGNKKKLKIDHDPGYTTILDFLYRLRIKSNYKDVEIFITEAPNDFIKGFSDNLSFIVFYTLILFEILIIKRCGLDKFLEIANDYCKKLGGQANILDKRLTFYKNLQKINKCPF